MPERETRQLSVVRKPSPDSEQSVLNPTEAPAIRGVDDGAGPIDYVCGGCRVILLEALNPGQVSGMVIKCPACGAHNATMD
jgi:hypothetical protein